MPELDAADYGQLPSRGSAIAAVKERIRWYVNRLRCMAPEEVHHRVRRALAIRAERWGLLGAADVPVPDLSNASRPWIRVAAKVDGARYLQAADRIAGGLFDLFILRGVELGSPPRWNRDPKTGRDAPRSFGKLLDYRNPRLVGDIKYLWELNRHHHIVTLAQAFALTGDTRHFDVIRSHLESWFDACPYRMGPNWSSALESAIRLINWSVAWQLLNSRAVPLFGDEKGGQFRRRWLESVFRHVEFVQGHLSLYSSANNHLIGEAAGMYVAAMTWPCWPRTRTWLAQSRAILEQQVLLQNAPDGVNREQSVSYQRFEAGLLLHPMLAARANGQKFSAAYESRIEAMIEYLASVMDTGGNLPMIGDSDDGVVVNLAPDGERHRYRSLLALGAILFRRGDFKAKAGGLSDEARWFAGESAESAFRQIDETRGQLPVRRAFPIGGYYVLGCEFETGNEIRLVVDAGPLGYQSIAAHGHADALAFTLSVGGKELLVDPGTYAYHTQPAWRQYFRGTAAHNTVRIDGVDQSQPGGNFMWLHKADAGCSLWRPSDERDVFEGWHDGYLRLADPVMHRRRITLEKRARRLTIEDSLRMRGTHEVELFFHCSERCRVDPVPGGYRISHGERALSLRLPQAADAATGVNYGSLAPISGWVSRKFDEKQPTPTIYWRGRLAGNSVLRSEIAC
jgi:heparinase II/III-like protein